MRKIGIVGKVDTRVLVYPILRALSMNGLTVVVTDDGAYRRFYRINEEVGNVSGVDIIVGSKIDKELKDKMQETGIGYDNIVYVSSEGVPDDVDGVIVCSGVDKSIESKKVAENEEYEKIDYDIGENVKRVDCFISYEIPSKKDSYRISLKDGLVKYVYYCEERGLLEILDSKEYNKLIAELVSKVTDIGKEEMFKLLTRKEYTNSVKVK